MASVVSRWATLTVGMLVMLCAGTVYGFGAIRSALKHDLNADESQMGVIALLGNLGLWTGSAIGGMFLDLYGPRPGMAIGGLLQSVGYILLSAALGGDGFLQHIPGLTSTTIASVAWLLCGLGCGFLYNTAMFTSAGNFSSNSRGLVIGLLATVFGLSPATCIIFLEGCIGGVYQERTCVHGFPNNKLAPYALVVAVIVLGVSVLAVIWSRQLTPLEVVVAEREVGADHQLRDFLIAPVCFLLWTTTLSLSMTEPALTSSAAIGTWAPLTLPVFGVSLMCLKRRQKQAPAGDDTQTLHENCSTAAQLCVTPSSSATLSVPLRVSVRMAEFWLLFYSMACIIGTNVATMNITSSIVNDRRIGDASVADMVQVITNSTSALFRCLGGLVLFFAPTIPGLLPVVFAGCISVVSQLLYSSGSNSLAYVAAISVGISDGVVWTTLPWLAGLLFGVQHVGSIFGCLVLLASTGVLLMGNLVEPSVYTSHTDSRGGECHGTECFFLYHIVAAAVALSGTVSAVVLHRLSSSRKRTQLRNVDPVLQS